MLSFERLKELRSEVSNMAFIALSKLTDKNARANIVKTGDDLQKLIDAEIARQSVKSEDVQEAIGQDQENIGTGGLSDEMLEVWINDGEHSTRDP